MDKLLSDVDRFKDDNVPFVIIVFAIATVIAVLFICLMFKRGNAKSANEDIINNAYLYASVETLIEHHPYSPGCSICQKIHDLPHKELYCRACKRYRDLPHKVTCPICRSGGGNYRRPSFPWGGRGED